MELQLSRPIVFIDVETTGTDTKNSRIVQLATLKMFTDGTKEVKNALINPGIKIPKEASDIHGINDETVANAPTFKQISKSFIEYISGCDLGGFKSNQFDFPLIYNELMRAGITWNHKEHRLIDVGNLYGIMHPRTLSAAYKHYTGSELTGAHSAEADIVATAEVFERMLEVHSEEIPTTVEELEIFTNYGRRRLDMSGCFVYDSDGKTILFNIGQQKGKPATDYGFLIWMLKKVPAFPDDTLAIVRSQLKMI